MDKQINPSTTQETQACVRPLRNSNNPSEKIAEMPLTQKELHTIKTTIKNSKIRQITTFSIVRKRRRISIIPNITNLGMTNSRAGMIKVLGINKERLNHLKVRR